VLASRSLETLTVLTIALALVLVVQAWFDALRSNLITRVGRVMDAHLAGPSLSALIRFGAAGLAQAKAHRPTNDLEQLRLFAAGTGPIVLADLPWMPLFVGACFLLHPLIGWLVLAGAGVLLTLGIIAERVARQTGAMEAERRGERLTLSEAARRSVPSSREWVRCSRRATGTVSKTSPQPSQPHHAPCASPCNPVSWPWVHGS